MSGYTFRMLKLALILSLGAAGVVAAQVPALVEMLRFSPHETRVSAFRLDAAQAIQIEAVGADGRFALSGAPRLVSRIIGKYADDTGSTNGWRGNAWIVDASTRKVVWELQDNEADTDRDGVTDFKGTVQLPAGTYEAYYGSYSASRNGINISLKDIRNQRSRRYDDDGLSEQFLFRVIGRGQPLEDAARAVGSAFQRTAVVSLTGLKPGESRRTGFSLDRPTRVELYAIGEAQREDAFDYGWIINADTRERVWEFDYNKSSHAGGAEKNRMARSVVTLPAGRYAAVFVLDDSHDATDWNAAPPHDPAFWGMTVRVVDASDRVAVRTWKYESVPRDALVSLAGVGNDELRSEGITVTRPIDVRVLALGEGTRDGMNDYGWIVDADTHRRVWTMTYDETEHGGGASKNRFASRTVRLEPGNYFVNYKTDGSHSFESWNSGQPMDGELWGVTLVAVNAADRAAVKPYDERAEEAGVLARLTGMVDDEDARATFTVDREANVRVYAIGEGSNGDMFDYAWIENRSTRQVVWEMTYRLTSHAGGASKNRQFDGIVHLPAGSYVLRYRSDDSHSTQDWNSDEPDDARRYGVTVYQPKK